MQTLLYTWSRGPWSFTAKATDYQIGVLSPAIMSKVKETSPFSIFFSEKICSHQSDHRIRVYIAGQSDCRIREGISHQSDCRTRVCISHQSYHRIEYLAPITAFGSYFLVNEVMDHGAMHKEWQPEIQGSFDKCNGLWPLRKTRLLRSRFIGIWKVRI